MPLRTCRTALFGEHDLVMLDLDGVVYVGPDAVPGAAQSLASVVETGTDLAYLTNNASRPASVVAQHLRDLGMPVTSDDTVVTSAQAVAWMMADDLPAGARVLLVGGAGLREPLEAAGLVCVGSLEDDPAAVVQGFHPDLGWADLAEAAYAVGRGLPWYASNTDLSVPTPRGTAPGNGSLVQAVANATGRRPRVAGKPERPLFDETLRRTGARAPLMVGDRLDTDIDGATALGIASLVVLTGVSDLGEIARLEPARRPAYVSADLRGLLDAHPPVDVDDGSARCGPSEASADDDGVVRLSRGEPTDTTSVRALVGLAWELADTLGASVDVDAPTGLGG